MATDTDTDTFAIASWSHARLKDEIRPSRTNPKDKNPEFDIYLSYNSSLFYPTPPEQEVYEAWG
jgi:hypothetical protein